MIIRYKRRIKLFSIAAIICLCLVVLSQNWFSFFSDISSRWASWTWVSGWLVFLFMVVLALLNIRKKLSFLPLGRAYIWVQFHIYGGLITALMYLLHTKFQWPNGIFESLMAVFFLLVVMSGLLGVYLSRSLPSLMNNRAERIFLSRIPGRKYSLAKKITAEVESCIRQGGQERYLAFYRTKIVPFLTGTSNISSHIIASQLPYQRWDEIIAAEKQFMLELEKKSLDNLTPLIHQKIDLDFQYVMQILLKGWLFVHIPLSFLLMLLALLHIILVYGFIGG